MAACWRPASVLGPSSPQPAAHTIATATAAAIISLPFTRLVYRRTARGQSQVGHKLPPLTESIQPRFFSINAPERFRDRVPVSGWNSLRWVISSRAPPRIQMSSWRFFYSAAKQKVITVPRPSSDSNSTRPPWASATLVTMASPKPPPFSLVVLSMPVKARSR